MDESTIRCTETAMLRSRGRTHRNEDFERFCAKYYKEICLTIEDYFGEDCEDFDEIELLPRIPQLNISKPKAVQSAKNTSRFYTESSISKRRNPKLTTVLESSNNLKRESLTIDIHCEGGSLGDKESKIKKKHDQSSKTDDLQMKNISKSKRRNSRDYSSKVTKAIVTRTCVESSNSKRRNQKVYARDESSKKKPTQSTDYHCMDESTENRVEGFHSDDLKPKRRTEGHIVRSKITKSKRRNSSESIKTLKSKFFSGLDRNSNCLSPDRRQTVKKRRDSSLQLVGDASIATNLKVMAATEIQPRATNAEETLILEEEICLKNIGLELLPLGDVSTFDEGEEQQLSSNAEETLMHIEGQNLKNTDVITAIQGADITRPTHLKIQTPTLEDTRLLLVDVTTIVEEEILLTCKNETAIAKVENKLVKIEDITTSAMEETEDLTTIANDVMSVIQGADTGQPSFLSLSHSPTFEDTTLTMIVNDGKKPLSSIVKSENVTAISKKEDKPAFSDAKIAERIVKNEETPLSSTVNSEIVTKHDNDPLSSIDKDDNEDIITTEKHFSSMANSAKEKDIPEFLIAKIIKHEETPLSSIAKDDNEDATAIEKHLSSIAKCVTPIVKKEDKPELSIAKIEDVTTIVKDGNEDVTTVVKPFSSMPDTEVVTAIVKSVCKPLPSIEDVTTMIKDINEDVNTFETPLASIIKSEEVTEIVKDELLFSTVKIEDATTIVEGENEDVTTILKAEEKPLSSFSKRIVKDGENPLFCIEKFEDATAIVKSEDDSILKNEDATALAKYDDSILKNGDVTRIVKDEDDAIVKNASDPTKIVDEYWEPPGSRKPLWIPPKSPHNLIEESLYDNPWGLLVATIFLNKTTCEKAAPFIREFLRDFRSPHDVLEVKPRDLERYFVKIGLVKRSVQVWRMSHDFVHKRWKGVRELHGIGKYGEDAFEMFCLGNMDVEPQDRFLRIYKAWFNMFEANK